MCPLVFIFPSLPTYLKVAAVTGIITMGDSVSSIFFSILSTFCGATTLVLIWYLGVVVKCLSDLHLVFLPYRMVTDDGYCQERLPFVDLSKLKVLAPEPHTPPVTCVEWA